MNSRTLYQFIGVVVGFALIDYGFDFIAVGLPGTREMTSQFIGVNMLLGGSVVVFISLFSLLGLAQTSIPSSRPESGAVRGIGNETVAEEQTSPQFRSYRNIENVGYVMIALGIFAAADLVLQVFILHNEARGWVDALLLVVSELLVYAIFGSLE